MMAPAGRARRAPTQPEAHRPAAAAPRSTAARTTSATASAPDETSRRPPCSWVTDAKREVEPRHRPPGARGASILGPGLAARSRLRPVPRAREHQAPSPRFSRPGQHPLVNPDPRRCLEPASAPAPGWFTGLAEHPLLKRDGPGRASTTGGRRQDDRGPTAGSAAKTSAGFSLWSAPRCPPSTALGRRRRSDQDRRQPPPGRSGPAAPAALLLPVPQEEGDERQPGDPPPAGSLTSSFNGCGPPRLGWPDHSGGIPPG